jgi:hypothetical protein
MNRFTYGLLAAGALSIAALTATAAPAEARSNVQFSITLGNVQIAYDDGYYDSNRRWHRWRNNDERNWYRKNHRNQYFAMRRDRDNDRFRKDWRNGKRKNWRR